MKRTHLIASIFVGIISIATLHVGILPVAAAAPKQVILLAKADKKKPKEPEKKEEKKRPEEKKKAEPPKAPEKKEEKKKPEEKKKAEPPKVAPEAIPKEYAEALKTLERQEWTKAVELLKKSLEKSPEPKKNYYPQLYLGVAYLNLGELESARKNCSASKAPKDAINQCLALIAQAAETQTEAKKEELAPQATEAPEAEPTQAQVETSETPEPESEPTQAAAEPTEQPQPEPTVEAAAQPEATPEPTAEAVAETETPASEATPEATEQTRAISDQLPAIAAPQQVGKTYAVVIGLGEFADERIPPLRYTVNDAQAIYDVLIDPNSGGIPKENVSLLLNQDATAENIKRAIGSWLKQQAGPDDTIIIYFAGHGAPEGEETYWVTYNADIDDLYATALSNRDISDMLDRVESKRVITLLDSCYSAATVNRTNRTRAVAVEIPWDQFSGEGRVAISASDGTQLSLEMDEFEHGVFTYYLLDGLKGKADGMAGKDRDGMVEIEELWNYVRNSVTDTAKKQGNRQTPVFQGSLTAGIPLTYDLAYLKELEQQRLQQVQEKQGKLKTLFEQKQISAQHFDCAFRMLDAGQSDGYLDGLLSEEISPETFAKLFTCPL